MTGISQTDTQSVKPLPGELYRHFKGHIVRVLYLAMDATSTDLLVVYRHMDSQNVWVRPYKEFTEVLDRKVYPDADQVHRFEPVQEGTYSFGDREELIQRIMLYIKDYCGGTCHCGNADFCLNIEASTSYTDLKCPVQLFLINLMFERT